MTMLYFVEYLLQTFIKRKSIKKISCSVLFASNFLTFYYLRDTIPFTNIGQILLEVLICFEYF